MSWAKPVKRVLSVRRWPMALATPKSMTLGTGLSSWRVTRMLEGFRSRWMMPFWWACWTAWQTVWKRCEAVADAEAFVVAVVGDRDAADQLHDEVGAAGGGGAGVEDAGDVGVVHHGQGLALGLEAGDDVLRVHAGLDDLERDAAADGLELLGHVDDAHAALADLFEQLVGADEGAGALGGRG